MDTSLKAIILPRLHMLDGLRGVCAILVMVYHFLSWNSIELFQLGTFGVYIFFILSGFSLWYVYGNATLSHTSLRSFYVARFARIFPLYVLVSTWAYIDSGNLKNYILNATFLFGLATPGHTSAVVGGWSIGIEWVFYLVFPLFWIFKPTLRMLFALLAISIAINQIYVTLIFREHDLGSGWHEYVHFPVFLVYFVAGVLCAALYQWVASRKPSGLSGAQELICGLLALVALAAVFLFPSASVEDYLNGYHFTFLIVASSAAILLCACIRNIPARVQCICKFLGDISFSTYLLHYYVYTYAKPVLNSHFPDMEMGYMMAIFVLITVALAYMTFRFYEQPVRNFINKSL